MDKVRGRQARQFRNGTQFLSWCCEELEKLGKKVLLLIWENASWHVSKEVLQVTRKAQQEGQQEWRPSRGEDRELPFAETESLA